MSATQNMIVAALCMLSLRTFAETSAAPPLSCEQHDLQCAAQAAAASPVRKMSYWSGSFARPLERRVGPAPIELLTYLNLENIAGGFPNRPRSVAISADLQRDIDQAVASLPSAVKRLAESSVAGILLVRDLGGTGYTDYVAANGSHPEAGFVVLDMDVLGKMKANAWATWKESSPFFADSDSRLYADIELPSQDDRQHAIQYILLHELGHIVSIGRNLHPRWDQPPPRAGLDDYRFARLSWRLADDKDRYVSLFEATFPLRKDVVYYFGPRLDSDQMPRIYAEMATTNFPTLYAATSPGDDFAESFASYVHTVLLKRPFQIRIYQRGKLVTSYRSCWDEARCATKRKIIEDLLR